MLFRSDNVVSSYPAPQLFFLKAFLLIVALLLITALPAQTIDSELPDSAKAKNNSVKPHLISKLPKVINETSGLVFFNGMLFTINDSDNPAAIYQVDTTTGATVRTIIVANAVNHDWEAITHDDSNVYIGDFGNNYGNRTDLQILKITKSDILNSENDTVEAGFIRFSYPDQTSFERKLNNNNFDCEAFFYYHDSLHLFSKNWSDLKSKHYVISSDTGTYQAELAGQFYVDGLITDASVNAQGNIVLLGYKNIRGRKWECFCWLFQVADSGICFNSNTTRIELGSAWHLGQTEGIFLNNDNTAWLSSESIMAGKLFRPAKLFKVNLNSSYLILRNFVTGNIHTNPGNSHSGE
jgi:hypothetical protein